MPARLFTPSRALCLVIMTGLSMAFSQAQAFDVTDDLEVSGFVRAVVGYLDDDKNEIVGYKDDVSVEEQSLIAIQPTYSISDSLTITGQFLGHSNSDRKSGTEWLYVSYQPNNSWQFRGGKLRMPFFSYSDSIDVGYSYPWITAPIQVYNNYLFPTFNGVSGSYNYAGEHFALYLEGYYGYFDGEIFMAGSRVDVEARVTDLKGAVINLRSNNLSLRLSYHNGHNKTEVPQVDPLRNSLRQANFAASANSLNFDGAADFYQASLGYDTFTSFYKAEWVKVNTEFDLAPSLTGYYLTAGHTIEDWTIHLTYAASSYSKVRAQQELRPLLSDQTNPLFPAAAGYFGLFDSVPNGSLDSYTLGARWDFDINMAVKAEVTFLDETAPRSGFFGTVFTGAVQGDLNEKKSATLYQLGWEWIF